MDDILAKKNRHLFLEEKDNQNNSFIRNINYAVENIDTIKTFNDNVNSGTMQHLLETYIEQVGTEGNAWVVKLTELGENILATTSGFNYATVLTANQNIVAGATVTLPEAMKYRVGTHMLLVSWNGTVCYNNEQYEEVGSFNEKSMVIKIKQDIKIGDKLEFRTVALADKASVNLALGDAITSYAFPINSSNTERTLKERFSDIINVKDFGAKGDGETNDTEAIKSALSLANINHKKVYFPSGIYVCSETIEIYDDCCIVGNGNGYGYNSSTIILFIGTGTKSYSISGCTEYSVANPDVGSSYLADSGIRGNTYKTVDYTQSFSVAVILGKRSKIYGISIIPSFSSSGYGTDKYSGSSGDLSDEWDVGVWCRNADAWHIENCAVVGHWRKTALLISASSIGDGNIPSCEHGHAIKCQFRGFRGVSIRSERTQTLVSNWGFAGTDFINCRIDPLEHQSEALSTSSTLATPFDFPSACLEIDGAVMRGIQFTDCTFIGREDISIIAPKCSEIVFIGCYFESRNFRLNGTYPSPALVGARIITTDDSSLYFFNGTKYGIDFSSKYVRENSVTRYGSTNEGLCLGLVRDEEYLFPRFSSTIGIRPPKGGSFRVYDDDFSTMFYLEQNGKPHFSTGHMYFNSATLSLHASNGDFLNVYSTKNAELYGTLKIAGSTYPTPVAGEENGATEAYLGINAARWKEIFAMQGAINTSDERFKRNISLCSEDEPLMRAWGHVRLSVFQYADAVAKKGEQGARLHVGVVAQQVQAAFAEEGLDASRYSLFCYDEWNDEYQDIEIVDIPAAVDKQGKETSPAQTHIERQLVQSAGSSYGIRYNEALALECAYQRWLGEQRDAKIEALMQRISALENNR